MPKTIVNSEESKFVPSSLLELFQLDGTNLGVADIYYFVNGSNEVGGRITFNSQAYEQFPIAIEAVEIDGKGSLPRPKLTVSNIGGALSTILYNFDNLVGAQVTRRKVYSRFIDAVNFRGGVNPFGTPDTTAYVDDIFFINRKVTENSQFVQFELATVLEIDGAKLPNRQVLALVCPFRFRDASTCKYIGIPVTDQNNKAFVGSGWNLSGLQDKGQWNAVTTYVEGDYVYIDSTLPQTSGDRTFFVCRGGSITGAENSPLRAPSKWLVDACSRSPLGCRLHFPGSAILRGGFFPGVSRARIQ